MKGILFKQDMHQAIIAGRKTQTRRLGGLDPVNEDPERNTFEEWIHNPEVMKKDKHGFSKEESDETRISPGWHAVFNMPDWDYDRHLFRSRYQPGDIVYLKEPYIDFDLVNNKPLLYKYDFPFAKWKWKNKLFMPAKYARHFIEIISVRTERLHDISEHDAMDEGIEYDSLFEKFFCYQCLTIGHIESEVCEDGFYRNAIDSFTSLWKSINGRKSWNKNPWVWVYSFRYLKNIHNMEDVKNYNFERMKEAMEKTWDTLYDYKIKLKTKKSSTD